MLSADDVGALVVDCGTYTTRVGFAGENTPKCVIPSFVGVASADSMSDGETARTQKASTFVGQDLAYRRDGVDVVPAVVDGLVENFDAAESIWRHCIESTLRVDPVEHPLLFVESAFNDAARRERCCEIVMETFQAPAVFIAKDAVLSAFAAGRSTALVLQSGAGLSSAVAVHDGYALMQGKVRSRVAGNALDEILAKLLEESSKHPIEPRFLFKRDLVAEGRVNVTRQEFPLTTASFSRFMKSEVVRDLKHSVTRVSDVPFSSDAVSSIPTLPYELPDGHSIDIGIERFTLGEQLFNPSPTLIDAANDFDGYAFEGLPAMVRQVIDNADVDIRRDLFGNIIVTGGTTSIRGLSDRLSRELMATAAPAYKVKTLSVGTHHERLYGSWIGGSILGSLESFHQMWFSKSEYEERGAAYIASKCP